MSQLPGAQFIAQGQLSTLENVLFKWPSWSKPLAGNSADVLHLQALFCSLSSLLLGLSERNAQILLLTLTGRNLVKLVSFRNFLKLF